ncbi:MAG: hypothetical protein WA197_05560 [Candidatus Acidiferrales bacterium]
MRKARTVLAGISPVVPEAGKHADFLSVIADRAAKMSADVADRFDLSFVFIEQNVVVGNPAGELTGLLQLSNRGQVPEVVLSTFLSLDADLCSG